MDLGDRIEALYEKQQRESDFGVGNLSIGQTGRFGWATLSARLGSKAP